MTDIFDWKKHWDHFDQDLYIRYLIAIKKRDE